MKTYRAKSGPFAEQPFYEPAEVELICADELQKVNLYPSAPEPIRIDRFIEKRFKVQPTYEELPSGVLGFTRFGAKGVEEVVVAKSLDDEGTTSAERRLRTTLAHEGGHGLMHTHLFVLGPPPDSLFGEGLAADAPTILCRDGGVSGVGQPDGKKRPYRWWEFQANLAMGALLLPKPLVAKALEGVLMVPGAFGHSMLPAERRSGAIQVLSVTFDVNPIVAKIRLESLYPSSADRQLTL